MKKRNGQIKIKSMLRQQQIFAVLSFTAHLSTSAFTWSIFSQHIAIHSAFLTGTVLADLIINFIHLFKGVMNSSKYLTANNR